MTDKLIIETEHYKFAKDWHKLFPPMIVVSITNACNLKCIHCYHSKFVQRKDYHKSMLSWDVWEKICNETSDWPEVILNFGTDGEPLLHPRFIDMLRLARKNNIFPINVTTNGVLLTEKINKLLITENLIDIINISIDAFTPETYKKIRGGGFKKLMSNVQNLIDLKNHYKSSLKIQVNIIDQPEASNELNDFKKYWDTRVDHIMIRTYYDATSVIGETGPNITGKQQEFSNTERWPCQQLWRRFNIRDDGTVGFCVDDWFNKSKIGDLCNQSIAEIWQSEIYNQLRHQHNTGQFEKIPYCHKCTEWQGMKWDYDYFTAMSKMLGKNLL